ncbi:hypothetical protein ACIOJD_33610 [Streptomyces sp. NPDC088116]|uniref:hypothetical protein n=1 Tax=Streptomyces sp. NPDC088116 TaxID=3365825 RepID=UPI003826A825
MHHIPQPLPDEAVTRLKQLVRRAARHRRAAAGHMLRGACYGIGTGAVSLLTLWFQRYL